MFSLKQRKSWLSFLTIFIVMTAARSAETNDALAKAFQNHEVVPDVIPVAPTQLLQVSYDNGLKADKGNELTPTGVQNQPKLVWEADDNAYYTVILTDPDAPSRKEPKSREFKHWLVGNVKGNDISSGKVLAAYIGSGPPQGTGLHRYVFLVYKQPSLLEFDEEPVANNSAKDRPKFKAADFAKKYNLGNPIAGNFYQAQYDDYVPILHQQLSGK